MEIKFFDDKLERFIDGLEKSTIAKVLHMIDLLSLFGQHLRMPHSKNIGGGLLELRVRSSREVRIIYVFHNNAAVLLHGFIKKTQRIPRGEVETAQRKLSTLDTI